MIIKNEIYNNILFKVHFKQQNIKIWMWLNNENGQFYMNISRLYTGHNAKK